MLFNLKIFFMKIVGRFSCRIKKVVHNFLTYQWTKLVFNVQIITIKHDFIT